MRWSGGARISAFITGKPQGRRAVAKLEPGKNRGVKILGTVEEDGGSTMILSNIGKTLAAASLAAGLALVAAPSPGKAAAPETCSIYARDVANAHAPRYRGLVGGLVALPFDVTGALLTGQTPGDFRWKGAYDAAYADCMSGRRVAVVVDEPEVALAVRPRGAAWLEYCAAKYRSFDPETGTYVTYSGEVVPCR
jgi:hypothetical protein